MIRVLLIEDNPGDARLVEEMFKEVGANQFVVKHVEGIGQGLASLAEELFQIILLDLSLPDGYGLGTHQRIQSAASHIPIVILTGLDDERVALQAVQEGAQDYLVKGQMNSTLLIRSIRYAIERKRASKEKEDLEQQLRQSQKMEAIGRLAGGIAHDFNNLLTVISGNAELFFYELQQDNPLRTYIEDIKQASERGAELIRQLLAFSRHQIMEMKILDINLLLKNLNKMLNRIIGDDVELVTVFKEDLGKVKVDEGQIMQVIMNLTVNARDAMPGGGKLTVETTNVILDEIYCETHKEVTPGRYVMLSVSDTGQGMTPKVKEQIFEPFFTTKEMGKGTGLGLSTVYGIVKQSGGHIQVYSEVGWGTTFKIYLPRIDELDEVDSSKATSCVSEFPRGSETILLVEDDEEVRRYVHKTLGRYGYTILEAVNADDAIGVIEKHMGEEIHLLLTDVVMPGMNGRDCAECLISFSPEMKVLYMSGYTAGSIIHQGLLEPGAAFLQKPFTPETLLLKVRQTLDHRVEKKGEAIEELRLGNIGPKPVKSSNKTTTGEMIRS
jgi:signal transduction histidine kinase